MTEKVRKPVGKKVVKTPITIQMEALECGAACLCMVLHYCGRYVPLEQLREDCNINRDGANAAVLMKVANHYDLKCRPVHAGVRALREKGTFPCILFWNNNHFVVLRGFRGKRAYINDPARGAYSVSMEEFERCFTGICIFVEPTDSFVPGGEPETMRSVVKRNLKGAGFAFGFIVLATLITTLVGVFNPLFAQAFLDQVLTGEHDEWLYIIISGMSILLVIGFANDVMKALVNLRINAKLAAMRSTAFFEHVLRMPMAFFSQRSVGDLQSRQTTCEGLTGEFVNVLAPLGLSMVMLVVYLAVILNYSVVLSAIGIFNLLINLLVSRFLSYKQLELYRVKQRDSSLLAGATVGGISMAETIKANGAEVGFFGRWAGYQANVTIQTAKSDKVAAQITFVSGLISSILSTWVLIAGVYLIVCGDFTAGALMAFTTFLQQFISPATQIINANSTLIGMRSEVERVDDVMNHGIDPLLAHDTPHDNREKLKGAIELRNVVFGYSKFKDPLIEGLNIKVEPGEMIAFVGGSGCGKSTIANILSGILVPQSGEVLFDGIPIENINRSVFTSSVAMVDQEIVLFEETVLENIRMLDASIDESEVMRAAQDACIHDDIMAVPGNYHLRVREGGTNFSGGQRQRIEIARALVGDPSIIILDEATSSLDAVTEADIMRSVKARNATCIIIAHRLSTVRDCDCIYVLDEGSVVQSGTHAELMAQDGLYRDLVMSD